MYNEKIADLFDFKSTLMTKEAQKNVKIVFSYFFVYVEHNFRVCFGTNNITEDIIASQKFKEQYRYLAANYKVEKIKHLIDLFRNCRNAFCHLLVRSKENQSLFRLEDPMLLSGLNFFDDTVCEIDGDLTLQGMFSLLMLFLSNEAQNELIDLLSSSTDLKITEKFFDRNKENGMSGAENAFATKNSLKARFKNFCAYSFVKNSKTNKIYFEYSLITRSIAEFILNFESLCYNLWDVRLCQPYSSFGEGLSETEEISGEAKELVKIIRNRWAHGWIFENQSTDDDNIVSDLLRLLELLIADFSANARVTKFLRSSIEKFASHFYRYKYKRTVELAFKIAHPEDYEPEKRINSMSNIKLSGILTEENERLLWRLKEQRSVTFNFEFKLERAPEITTDRIDVYMFLNPNERTAKINGFEVHSRMINVSTVNGIAPPTVAFTDEEGVEKQTSTLKDTDLGFAVIHHCVIE
ncbi:MAG: hypothetical protein IKD45_00745 [Clostridia bacterium]|nr:hypothetical protein [Clostridia bacterium]